MQTGRASLTRTQTFKCLQPVWHNTQSTCLHWDHIRTYQTPKKLLSGSIHCYCKALLYINSPIKYLFVRIVL
uniref:Uncharacterized protein n=1 Tax=Anguilla anguilla TaxID=7936 RepID=A0A0E9X7D3_ANGAN